MFRKTKQKLTKICMVATIMVSLTLIPLVVNAATTTISSPITRLGGNNRYETAAIMVQKGWTGVSDNVVLSAGMNNNLVDALAAGPLASKLKAPIILTDEGQSLNSFAKVELLRLKPKTAYITSGLGVIKSTVLEELKAMGITTVQLGGSDRFETSVNIAKEMEKQGVTITSVMLAAGWYSPADALSVASIAAIQGIPILSTSKDELPASVKTYLDSISTKVTNSYVIGGTGVITDNVKGQLPGIVNRYSGKDRYETNEVVLKNFTKQYKNEKVYVANGETLVDALAGVPLAAADQAPIVLVNQQLADATKNFVKLNMSTQDMVALGGEAVVPSVGMNALTTVGSYATDNVTEGSTDVSKPVEIADNILITGNNVTLQNAKINYSVYVKGNNVTLKNLNVNGTVFVDPGVNGTATLDGVTAANIVILSGAPHSVNITRSTSGQITISSNGNTNVVLTSVTTNGVSVQTAVVYQTDSSGNQVKTGTITITSGTGNNLGAVTITSDPGKTTEVNLNGSINQPINVMGQGGTSITAAAGTVVSNITSDTNNLTLAGAGTYTAVVAESGTLTAAPGTVLASVTVATLSSSQTVTLAGNMGSVTQTQGNVTLAAGATVTTMTSTASNAVINVPPGASIGTLTSSTDVLVGGGGTVNGETTSTTPSEIITETPPSSGGATQLTVASVSALDSNIGTHEPVSGIISFSGDADSILLTGLQLINANVSTPNIVITSINARNVNWIENPISAMVDSTGKVSISTLLGGLDRGNDGISLGNLRLIFGTGDVVLTGHITKSGNYTDSSNITVTLRLGAPTSGVATISNTWMTVAKTGAGSAQVSIKHDQGNVTLGAITDANGGNFNFTQVVAAIALSGGDVSYSGSDASALQAQIVSTLNDAVFNSITLSQLAGKTINFGTGYTVTFVQLP